MSRSSRLRLTLGSRSITAAVSGSAAIAADPFTPPTPTDTAGARPPSVAGRAGSNVGRTGCAGWSSGWSGWRRAWNGSGRGGTTSSGMCGPPMLVHELRLARRRRCATRSGAAPARRAAGARASADRFALRPAPGSAGTNDPDRGASRSPPAALDRGGWPAGGDGRRRRRPRGRPGAGLSRRTGPRSEVVGRCGRVAVALERGEQRQPASDRRRMVGSPPPHRSRAGRARTSAARAWHDGELPASGQLDDRRRRCGGRRPAPAGPTRRGDRSRSGRRDHRHREHDVGRRGSARSAGRPSRAGLAASATTCSVASTTPTSSGLASSTEKEKSPSGQRSSSKTASTVCVGGRLPQHVRVDGTGVEQGPADPDASRCARPTASPRAAPSATRAAARRRDGPASAGATSRTRP